MSPFQHGEVFVTEMAETDLTSATTSASSPPR
jgi:CTP synthase (UTP-ammonia lyase)